MSTTIKRIFALLLVVLLAAALCIPALAVTEAEVEAQVNNAGKESVTGSVLVWFLCALGFLKVSQKIDSIMASLGVNAGRTGGSLLGEAMVAMRAVTMIARGGKGAGSSRSSANGSSGTGSGSSGWFLKGGLAGAASRHVTNSAVKTATTQTSAVNTVQPSPQKSVSSSGAQTGTAHNSSQTREGNTSTIQPDNVPASNIPEQDGVIVTGGENAPSIPTMENAPIQTNPSAKGMMPDLTQPVDSAAAANTTEPRGTSIRPDHVPAFNIPAQDGVIVTGEENAPSISAMDYAPSQTSPPESGMPPDLTPPDNSVAAAHSSSEPQGGNMSSIQPDNVPVSGIPEQDGVIATGVENAPSISTLDNAPIQTSPSEKDMPLDPTQPDNAVIQMTMPGDNSVPVGSSPTEMYQPASDSIPPESPSIESGIPAVQDGIPFGNPPVQDGIPSGNPLVQDGIPSESPPVQDDTSGNPPVQDGFPSGNPTVQDGIPSANPSFESGVSVQDSLPQDGIIITGDNVTTLPVSEGGVQSGAGGERVTVGGSERQTVTSRETVSHSAQSASATEHSRTHSQSSVNRSQVVNSVRPSLGGMIFSKSLAAGGSFANSVIGTVARGEVAGSISGDMAVQSLASYLGHANMIGAAPSQIPYCDVEIGRGRITGTEIMPEHPEGISFTMYNAAQYVKPEDPFQKVQSADGQTWYKQYAVDTVKKTPFQSPEGKIGHTEEIVKRMPKAPQRKERM